MTKYERHDVVGVLRVHDDRLDREDHGPEDEIDREAAARASDEVAERPGDEDCCDEFHGRAVNRRAAPASSPREGNFASSPGGTTAGRYPSGSRACRRQPPSARGPASRPPPSASTRSRMPARPSPGPRPPAATGATAPPSRTSTSSAPAQPTRTRTVGARGVLHRVREPLLDDAIGAVLDRGRDIARPPGSGV